MTRFPHRSIKENSVLFILLFLFAFIGCNGCSPSKPPIGKYVAKGYLNSIDTIQLLANGKYTRRVYNTKGVLLLDMIGEWSIHDDDVIKFSRFYLNLDDDLTRYPSLTQDTVGTGSGYVHIKDNEAHLCFGYYAADLSNQNCYTLCTDHD